MKEISYFRQYLCVVCYSHRPRPTLLYSQGNKAARPESNNGDITMQIQTSHSQTEIPPALLTLAMIRRYYLPIASRTLFRLISSGRFPKADIGIGGKLRLWKRETVEAWIASNAVRAGVE